MGMASEKISGSLNLVSMNSLKYFATAMFIIPENRSFMDYIDGISATSSFLPDFLFDNCSVS